jgi:hypothetical protein
MRLFEVTEYVKDGLRFVRDGKEPHVARPAGCPLDVRLHPRIIEVVEKQPDQEGSVYRLDTASIDFMPGLLLLKPEVSAREQQALVRVETAGGVGGKAYLTGNVLEERMNQGRVSKRPSTFPPLGVQPFCTDDELARLRNGVDILDVLLLMNPGSNFCVRRTGELEGAPPVLSIRWVPWNKDRPPLMIDSREQPRDEGGRWSGQALAAAAGVREPAACA